MGNPNVTHPSPALLPFSIGLAQRLAWGRQPAQLLERAAERLLGLHQLNEIYLQVTRSPDARPFSQRALEAIGVNYQVSDEELQRIPRQGPAVVIANHPYGGIEGMVMDALLTQRRSDVRILANYLLARIPDMRSRMIFVDPFGSEQAVARNLGAMRQALRWLEQGGLLVVFPAGEVAHLSLREREVADPPWSLHVTRLIRRTHAPVIPIYFPGHNGWSFQLAGLIHPRIRTALLPRQLLNKRGRTLQVRIGHQLPWGKLADCQDDKELTGYLRLRTYILGSRETKPTDTSQQDAERFTSQAHPIVDPVDPGLLQADVAALPQSQALIVNGEYTCLFAHAQQIPNVLQEIGRLRELTFRLVNEGTGREIDLDQFDPYYLHLFIWNSQTRQVVGAYRMGQTDQILAHQGMAGLYTYSLFEFDYPLMEQLTPALELGRSWVRPEYQRSFYPLMMLWKGIGAYVVRFPHYHNLFGPVSINSQYNSISRRLIVTFLQANNYQADLARFIRARNRRAVKPITRGEIKASSTVVRDMEEISSMISEIEHDQKGVPILLKQYLKLNAQLLGFNVDQAFGDVLDGLMLIDLTHTDRRILEKFMGKEEAAAYLAYHQRQTADSTI